MLDNRLKKIAELVSGVGTAVDVGTDHEGPDAMILVF